MTTPRTRRPSVDEYVASLAPEQRALVDALRTLVKSAARGAVETFKWSQPVYESNGPFAYIKAHRSHVTFGFWRGVELSGDSGLLVSSGSKMAHLKIRSLDEIPEAELRRLVREAVKLNAAKGDPTRR